MEPDFDQFAKWLSRHPIERDDLPKLPHDQLVLVAQRFLWGWDRERVLRKMNARQWRRAHRMLEQMLPMLSAAEARGIRNGKLVVYLREGEKIKEAERIAEGRLSGGIERGKQNSADAAAFRENVHSDATKLLQSDLVEPRSIAGMLAKKYGKTAKTVRSALRGHESGHWAGKKRGK